MKTSSESTTKRKVRQVLANIKAEQKHRVIKYFDHTKDESDLAKPRYTPSQFPQRFSSIKKQEDLIEFCISDQNLMVSKVGILVEPMIETEDIPIKPIIGKNKVIKSPVFFTEVPSTFTPIVKQTEIPATIKRSTKQQMMNKEILRRLGLLSVQAKRELEIEKLSNRALKLKKEEGDYQYINKNQMEVIKRSMKEEEKQAQELSIQRCTTSASAASRKAYDIQDDYLIELISERHNQIKSAQSVRNRPQTQQTKCRIHKFFKTVTEAHLNNVDEIKREDINIYYQMKSIKESLQSCKRKLLDYNDEIEIALTEDIKGQVMEYKNIIKNNNTK